MTGKAALRLALRLGFGLMLAVSAVSVFAGRPTMNECLEGSDFIRNAALSRDAGIAADAFIDRLHGDFLAIRAFPAELRWFVHDEGDEEFLAGQVHLVFDQPSDPDDHQLRFLHACVDRMADN